jgi:hypothetical protein
VNTSPFLLDGGRAGDGGVSVDFRGRAKKAWSLSRAIFNALLPPPPNPPPSRRKAFRTRKGADLSIRAPTQSGEIAYEW